MTNNDKREAYWRKLVLNHKALINPIYVQEKAIIIRYTFSCRPTRISLMMTPNTRLYPYRNTRSDRTTTREDIVIIITTSIMLCAAKTVSLLLVQSAKISKTAQMNPVTLVSLLSDSHTSTACS